MHRYLAKYTDSSRKNIVTIKSVKYKRPVLIPRFIASFIIAALVMSSIPLFTDNGLVSGADFAGDYRVDDTGTGTSIQWIPTIDRRSNGDIYAAWYDTRGSNGSGIYFTKSTDGGQTFGKNVVVNDSATYTYTVFVHNSYIAVDNSGGTYDGNIYVAWEDVRNDPTFQNNYDIYFARSTDGGASFGTNIKIVDDTKNAPQVRPALAVDNSGNLYSVWTDLRDTSGVNTDLNIYFAKSTNGGASFGTNKRVDDGPGKSVAESPSIAVNETGVIYVAWHDNRNGNADIYFAKSTDGGTSFSTSTRITSTSFSTSGKLSFPSITASGSNVYIAWSDNQSGNWDIRMAYSVNGGTSWKTPVKVNDDTGSSEQFYPDVTLDNNNTIYIAWHDDRNGDFDIFSANSTNGGSSFGTNSRVDHDAGSATQRYASVIGDPGGGFIVAWEDWRNDADGRFVSGGGTDFANNPDIYLASGGAPMITFASSSGKPPTPENLKVMLVPTGSAFDITWDKLNVLNLANYTIYRSMDGNTYGRLVDIPADTIILQFTDAGVTNGLTYYYKISSKDNNGNESNLSLAVANIPDIDTDLDDVGNENDWDDDGDGVSDFKDDFPLDVDRDTDTDNDGLDDSFDDDDDDNDRYSDLLEQFLLTDPLNPWSIPPDFDGDFIPDVFDIDIDNDGVNNTVDDLDFNEFETVDQDGDGFGDNADQDDDNDGILDYSDAFPFDLTEWIDTDMDGIGDASDTDDDNDGVPDVNDAFAKDPLEWNDTDGDGLGDNFDTDSDGDGVTNDNDAFPLDGSEWLDTDLDGTGDNTDTDDDDDGILDVDDAFPADGTEWDDTDGDGLGDNFDTDIDGDSYPNLVENLAGTDPFDPLSYPDDTDLDGISDTVDDDDDNDSITDDNDAFPKDSSEWLDTDGDGLGDNADTDDDNDGVLDAEDEFPLDRTEWVDTDTDGLGDNQDPDDDNDGVTDDNDAFPENPDEWLDTDADGVGDDSDSDDDDDDYGDFEDNFPKDGSEWEDTDGDGLGDNADTDDDDDGTTDDNDAFPLDDQEQLDTDLDGFGDNADTDSDNDGVLDDADAFPKDPYEWSDIDSDGIGDNTDTDDDGDGIPDDNDAFPENPTESLDTDLDELGDNTDSDDDGDNINDPEDKFPMDPKEVEDLDGDGIGDNIDQDDDNDGVLDVHDDYPLDSTRSKEPEGVNELLVPVQSIIGFAIALLVLVILMFNYMRKNNQKITEDFQSIDKHMKQLETRLLLDGPPGGPQLGSSPEIPQLPLASESIQPPAAAPVLPPAQPPAQPPVQPAAQPPAQPQQPKV